jgi:quercetin dioxygenase-like cupin family protein
MKNLFLFILTVGLVCSCNEGTKADKEATDPNEKPDKRTAQLNLDALTGSPENFRLLLENEHVRVLEYTVEPGEKDQWHTHPAKLSYVISGGKLKVHLENGEVINAEDSSGTASWMDYVGKHYVENVGSTPVKIILTEVKALQ